MLIIFDLDDTLIDTSGSVTPYKLQECVKHFLKREDDFDKAYSALLKLNDQEQSSKRALVKWIEQYGGNIDHAGKIMVSPLPAHFIVKTTPDAKEILKTLAGEHTLALVTGGYPPFQLDKLEKAGMDRSLFSKIAISEDSVKKPFYEALIREFSNGPEDVLVCGDRIEVDLAPAHALGCKTVHMRWGRGTSVKSESWITGSISVLSELKRMITI